MPLNAGKEEVFAKIKNDFSLPKDVRCDIYKKSFDCRHGKIKAVYSVSVNIDTDNEHFSDIIPYEFSPKTKINLSLSPVIVGMGPAGLFCALTLTEFGIKPIIIDRGEPIEKRVSDVEKFWRGEVLKENSNVQFGEGGAGTFSDGKLTCRKNDPRGRKVLETFVKYGAPAEILTDALPHIGTDILRKIIINIRRDLQSKGVTFIYNAKLIDIKMDNMRAKKIKTTAGDISCDVLVLAIGNGSFDTFSMLLSKKFLIEPKPLAIGLRQEHLQRDINFAMYGKEADNPVLPPASYSFFHHLDKNTCVYTFCMCPGGYVVNASSINGRLTTNGMSLSERNAENANSALLVSINPASVKEAMTLQREIEERAFRVNNGKCPITSDLEKNSIILTTVRPTIMPETERTDFSKIFPLKILSALKNGTDLFHKKIFKTQAFEKPIYTAPETRTSSPLRFKRDSNSLKAVYTENLYPCGEGAGYAGGIMSSAIDGIKIAEAILNN